MQYKPEFAGIEVLHQQSLNFILKVLLLYCFLIILALVTYAISLESRIWSSNNTCEPHVLATIQDGSKLTCVYQRTGYAQITYRVENSRRKKN